MADDFDSFERTSWATNDAAAYQQLFGPITSHPIDALLDAVRARPGVQLLDVATGPGYVAERAAFIGADVTGLDRSEQMLALARVRAPSIRFVEGNAEALGLPDASFDAVTASFVLLHLEHPERCAAELARVLRPGGRAAVTVWNTPDRARLFGVVLEAAERAGAVPPQLPPGPPFTRFAADAEMTKLFEDAGFREVTVQQLDWLAQIPTADLLWHGFANGTARTRALLISQSPAIRHAIFRELLIGLEEYRDGTGYAIPISVKLGAGIR